MHIPSIFNPFYVHLVFAITLLVAVYGFYRACMQVSSLHARLRSKYCHSDTDSFSTCVTRFTQLHTLFTCFFAPVLPTLCVHQVMALALEGTYVHTSITCAGVEALVCTYVHKILWNKTKNTSMRDPINIRTMCICYPSNNHLISVFLKQSTVQ